MKPSPALLLSLIVLLGGCSRTSAPAAEQAAGPAAQAAAPTSGKTSLPPPAPTGQTPAPATAPVSSAPPPAPAPTTPAATTPASALAEGTDYTLVAGGTPLEPGKAKVEVVEFFNYICPACNAFEPLLAKWQALQRPDVRVVYVPADFRPDFVAYARAYYAADALGLVGKTHEAVYRAIHQSHQLPAEGSTPDEQKIAAFYAPYGTSATVFENTMHGFAVDARLRQGHDFMVRSQVQSTPSLLINGRYLVKGTTFEDKLRIADALIAQERARP